MKRILPVLLSGIPLEQTVKCLFVSGEEQGLDGSRHFASLARKENWPVMAVLSNDMIGNVRASGTKLIEDHKVRVFSESRSGEDSDSRQLARYIKEMAAIPVCRLLQNDVFFPILQNINN